jgi:CheY-like chemotaxis protein
MGTLPAMFKRSPFRVGQSIATTQVFSSGNRDLTLYEGPIDDWRLSGTCLCHGALLETSPNVSWWHSVRRFTPFTGSSEKAMTGERLLVSVVDDDASVRESLPALLAAFGFGVRVFSSAEEFLESGYVARTRCLILDVAMPGMTGPDLQQELKNRGYEIPIVFITAHGDQEIRRRLLDTGAAECLFKPFSQASLRAALNSALRKVEGSV